ncbi:MAG: hypothetical protein QG559_402 [Campylobacterota bacterium]|nr:hypothetical protein [Campylobacterota bacterium]
MEIVLRNNLILVTTDFDTLNAMWMRNFLNNHSRGMLFLQKAVLVFRNETLKEAREDFIRELSQYHATKHDFSYEFFLRSMLKFGNQPIKIELSKEEKPQEVQVNLYAYSSDTVLISLDYPNSWVMSYLRSQLEVYIERGTDVSLVLDVSDYRAKARLDRALNKKNVLHYQIHYNFNEHFLSKLYSDFSRYSFGNLSRELDDGYAHFYAVLQCPVGASQEDLKENYKRLAKVYHPDKVANETPHMIKHYTQKFQLLQEAYSTLRGVS